MSVYLIKRVGDSEFRLETRIPLGVLERLRREAEVKDVEPLRTRGWKLAGERLYYHLEGRLDMNVVDVIAYEANHTWTSPEGKTAEVVVVYTPSGAFVLYAIGERLPDGSTRLAVP